MKVLSLFSGIGAFEKALVNLGIPCELIAYCEVDKYASKSYSAIHGVPEAMNLGDITKVDEKTLPKGFDLLTYGFPCQDISVAGKQKGLFNEDGTQTRSGLFFEALRIIEETKPKVAIAENVKNLTSKKFRSQFKIVLDSLEEAGYNNYFELLNAKDFGIPQNRERVFIVSIRKDIDKGWFQFPVGFPLQLRLKDMLEDEVDEKYYLSDKMKDYLVTITAKNKARGNGNVYAPSDVEGISKTITTKEDSRVKENFIEEPELHQICQLYPNSGNPQAGRVYSSNGISPTMDTCSGGNRMPKVLVREANKSVEPSVVGGIGEKKSNGGQQWYQQDRIYDDNIAISLSTGFNLYYAVSEEGAPVEVPCAYRSGGEPNVLMQVRPEYGKQVRKAYESKDNYLHDGNLRIRKLTPKECFRMMGFDDEDFAKASSVNSNTQLYKQAGNSIVVQVVEHIITALQEHGAL